MWLDHTIYNDDDRGIQASATIIHKEMAKLTAQRNKTSQLVCAYQDSMANAQNQINILKNEICKLAQADREIQQNRALQPIDSIYLELLDSLYSYKLRPRFNYVLSDTK
jgi:hypothetical protein